MYSRVASRLPSFLLDAAKIRSKRTASPRLMTYTVTFRCNARCIMCDSWKKNGDGDLTLTEIERVFRQLPKLDAIRLTGGEPFVRTDLPEIYQLAVQHLQPMMVHITTNGFLSDRVVKFCESRNKETLLQLMISLDGVEQHHNRIRGSSIAWKAATATLEYLAPKAHELNLDLVVNQTVVDRNGIEQYRLLRDYLKPMKVRHHAVLAYEASATYSLEDNVNLAPQDIGKFTTFGSFEESDFRELFAEIEKDLVEFSRFAQWAKKYYLKGIKQRVIKTDKRDKLLNPPCSALSTHLRMFPNGDVPTCQFNSSVVGNLKRQTFADVWNSHQTAAQRRWVNQCKGCWAECEVIPNAIYSLDMLRTSLKSN